MWREPYVASVCEGDVARVFGDVTSVCEGRQTLPVYVKEDRRYQCMRRKADLASICERSKTLPVYVKEDRRYQCMRRKADLTSRFSRFYLCISSSHTLSVYVKETLPEYVERFSRFYLYNELAIRYQCMWRKPDVTGECEWRQALPVYAKETGRY